MSDSLIIFGSGGHAKVVLEAAALAVGPKQIFVIDDDPDAKGRSLLGHEVLGGRDCLSSIDGDTPVALGIGGNGARLEILRALVHAGRRLATIVHPSATISPSAILAAGTFIGAGAIVMTEARIGEGAIINTAASVDHDCVISEGAHIAPGVRLCGNVTVGARALIGVGTAVRPGVRIGEDVVVGAGSAVVCDLEPGRRYAGCPAKPLD